MRRVPALLLFLALFAGCGGDDGGAVEEDGAADAGALSEAASAQPVRDSQAEKDAEDAPEEGGGPGVGLWFVDVTEASGLSNFRQVCGAAEKPFIVETIGAGVALVDVDRDGDLDAYLSNGSFFGADPDSAPADALYLNDGRGHFRDGTEDAGLGDRSWTTGVRVVDFDADGWPDLYLTNYGPNVLLHNLGDGRFEDVTEEAAVGDPGYSTGACFLDFDRDGDLDLYVANYVDFDEEVMLAAIPTVSYKGISVMKGPRGLPERADSFFINEGDGRFRDASEEVGIRGKRFFGFQCVAFDVNHDGWVDVYVANDSVENSLWLNRGGERFENAAFLSGLAFSMSGKPQAGMGIGIGDYDGDLTVDLYVTNFADDYFTLYRGTKRGTFVDVTHRLRLVDATKSSLGWGCGFVDFDADGDLEIFVADGHVYPQVDQLDVGSTYRQRNLLFEYDGKAYHSPEGSGGPGFALEEVSRGAAVGDVDGDGDLDLLFGNLDAGPTLLRNESRLGNWIRIRLVGAGGNRDAVGSRVVVSAGGREQLRLVSTAGSFLSSSDPTLFVGIGEATIAERVEVRWPDGRVDLLSNLPAGSVTSVREGAGSGGAASVETREP